MPKVRILLVQDDAQTALLTQGILQNASHVVSEPATSIEETVRLAGSFKPDLVLMEFTKNGTKENLVMARRIISRLAVPVLYLTNDCSIEVLEHWEDAEPIEILLKPFEEWELPVSVEKALERSAERLKAGRTRPDEAEGTPHGRYGEANAGAG
jgi:DNA-binding NtrC family response regulator